jgi:hypothetical protein
MFIYGKKRQSWTPLFCGLAMLLVSYFVSSALNMSLASIAILAIMYGLNKQGY